MRKLLAFILSFAIVFSAVGVVPVAAAGGISSEARALEALGMLVGDGNGVTEEYTRKEMTRFTAAISILKLRGLYEDALEYKGSANFVDKDEVKWAEGKKILAYLKANPDLGFIGDDRGRFNPYTNINEQSYFKVLLETLGYKQKVTGVKGDFSWDDTLIFASSIGLKSAKKITFTVDLLAKSTVAALKTKTKEGKIYINTLIDGGKIKRTRALAAGLVNEMLDEEVESVKAIGNTVVEVVFQRSIDRYDAESLDNYEIKDLTVKSAALVRDDAVRLVTSAQSSGRLYTLTVGDTKVKFTGVAKVSGSPRIKAVKSEDVETVVIEFDKELDFETATDTSSYTISGIDVEEAELEGKKVTLTTDGLVARKQYTVKVRDIKSVDGVLLRSDSKSFYTRLDTNPPTMKDAKAETNERVVIKFSEAITRASAEELSNYYIESSSGELEIYEAELVGDDDDTVELTTEPQKAGTKYELTVDNIEDQTKAANTMKRPAKKTFYGMRADTVAPQFVKNDLKALSRNHIQVVFSDNSKIDKDTVLDPNNYEITKSDRYKESIYVESVEKISYVDGKYKAMLRVEDLSIGSSYIVEAYNIEDEFGNVLEKNNSGTVYVAKDDFASATVKDYKVVSGNKLEIYFTKPLDEESAEDISNYYINNDIGAPMEAVYEDDKVTLETADMIEGKVYKINIDGVIDMTENNLRLSFEFRAIAGEDDNQGPELDYVYSVNKYVVAAVFDEPVTYTKSTTALVLKSGSKTITLYANALVDDDKTIEFSNVEDEEQFTDYRVYTIDRDESLKGIYDRTVNRNPFDRSDSWDYDMEVYGTDEEPENPEIYYVSQRDGKTFEMQMSKEVVVKDADVNTIGSPSATFEVKIEGDGNDIVTFTITSPRYIDDSKDYKIDIRNIVTDKHGIEAENTQSNYTMLYGEYKDEDKPYIVEVTALDRMTVEIEYSEAVSFEGKYTIKNTDDSAKYRTISNSLKKIDSNKVILSLVQPLEGRYDYELIIDIQAKDLVGNVSEDVKGDQFYFLGTDLAPVKVPEIEDQAAADLIISKIAALPEEIKLLYPLSTGDPLSEYKKSVEDVRKSYEALTKNQQALVTNYSKLVEAEARILAFEKEQQEEEDKLKAARVYKMIDELPDIADIELEDKEAVEDSREAYDALTSDQKNYVANYLKLVGAEDKMLELEEQYIKDEEERKAEEEAKKAAEAAAATAVEVIETAVSQEILGIKVTALSNSVEALKAFLTSYLEPIIIPDKTAQGVDISPEDLAKIVVEEQKKLAEKRVKLDEALVLANNAAGQADAAVLAAWNLEVPAIESVAKLEASDVKTEMDERIAAARSKIEKAAEIIGILKGQIAVVKDTIDVEDAKLWLLVEKFTFGTTNVAASESPRIVALAPHTNGAVYKYTEVGNIVDGKFVKNIAAKVEDAAFLEIVEVNGNVRVYRGAVDAAIILKVEITKGNVVAYKLFKVNIPSLSNIDGSKYSPVTIESK